MYTEYQYMCDQVKSKIYKLAGHQCSLKQGSLIEQIWEYIFVPQPFRGQFHQCPFVYCKIYNLNVVNGWKLISLALQPFALNVLQVCLQYCIISHITIYMCNTCCRQNKQPDPTCHVLTIKHRSNSNLTLLLYSQAGFASSIISEMISMISLTFSRGMLY